MPVERWALPLRYGIPGSMARAHGGRREEVRKEILGPAFSDDEIRATLEQYGAVATHHHR